MTLNINNNKDYAVCVFNGRLDAATSPDIEKKLLRIVKGGQRTLVFDLGGVEYLSSAGIRVLVIFHKTLKQVQGRIIYANISSVIQDILDLVGFLPHLDIRPTVSEAAESIMKG